MQLAQVHPCHGVGLLVPVDHLLHHRGIVVGESTTVDVERRVDVIDHTLCQVSEKEGMLVGLGQHQWLSLLVASVHETKVDETWGHLHGPGVILGKFYVKSVYRYL